MDISLTRIAGLARLVCSWRNDVLTVEQTDHLLVLTVYSGSTRKSEWRLHVVLKLGDAMVADAAKGLVYIAHQSEPSVFLITVKDGHAAWKEVSMPFAKCVRHMHSLRKGVAVVSEDGDVGLILHSTGTEATVKRVPVHLVERVVRVSAYGNELALYSIQNRHRLVMQIVHLGIQDDDDNVVQYPPVGISNVPRGLLYSTSEGSEAVVLGCVALPHAAIALYADGTVRIAKAPNDVRVDDQDSLGAWRISKDTAESENQKIEMCRIFTDVRLSQGFRDTNDTTAPTRRAHDKTAHGGKEVLGAVARIGGSYVAIAFGSYVSVWDSIYGIGHGYRQLKAPVREAILTSKKDRVILVTGSSLYALTLGAIVNQELTLANAVRRRGSCHAIVASDTRLSTDSPLRAQPVTVNVVKAEADAGGTLSRAYRLFLATEDGEDVRRVACVVNRSKTPSAAALSKITRLYVKEACKVRRGNYGRPAELGLARLPSERVAAAAVARCLYEIEDGQCDFVVPLIDMLGTGVVSNESVLAMLASARAWGMGTDRRNVSISSITSSLAKSHETLYALEAVVTTIPDLPESDIVRAAQYAIRVHVSSVQGLAAVDENGESANDNDKQAQRKKFQELDRKSRRILLRCVIARVDSRMLIDALRKMPLHDVSNMLEYFHEILNSFDPRAGDPFLEKLSKTQRKRTQNFTLSWDWEMAAEYRGAEHWLDNSLYTCVQALQIGSRELRGCMEWTCSILDAHLASLVLDPAGYELAGKLLRAVRLQRRLSERVVPVFGVLEHVTNELPLPRYEPPYAVWTTEVPYFAGLT